MKFKIGDKVRLISGLTIREWGFGDLSKIVDAARTVGEITRSVERDRWRIDWEGYDGKGVGNSYAEKWLELVETAKPLINPTKAFILK